MSEHEDRARHAYFCVKCRRDYERTEAGKCDVCDLSLVPSGYCPKCSGYWRLRVGKMCPEHDVPLEGEEAEAAQNLESEARALDPGLDPVSVYEGSRMECVLAHAAVTDAGIEAAVDDAGDDPLLAKLAASRPEPARVLVPKRHAEEARQVIRDFEKKAD